MTDKRIEDLSDDEIKAMSPEDFAALASTQEGGNKEGEEQENQEGDDTTGDDDQNAETEQGDATADAADEGEGDEAATESAPTGAQAKSGEAAKADEGKEVTDEAAAAEQAKVDQAAVDYAAEHAKLLAPFKANGREMKVESVDEARQLMSMGANYNKKMQAMKPHLATLRMLENAGIKDADLSYLIDLHRKDPAAINKLVSDSKIDPMDLSAEKAAGYTPGNHRPATNEVELDAVIEDLRGSPGFDRTLDVVANKMDSGSKQIVAQNPQVLRILTGHIESGIYDQVTAEVERQRMFGQLAGLSDLEAYRQVGDSMHAQGKFEQKPAGQPGQRQQAPAAPAVVVPDPKKADDSKRNAQKRGVAPVRGASAPSGKTVDPDFNPLSMSDEEFQKLRK